MQIRDIQQKMVDLRARFVAGQIGPQLYHLEMARLDSKLINLSTGRGYERRWNRDSDPFDPHCRMDVEA